MKSNILFIRSILTLLLFGSSAMLLEAASPNFQPVPLRNHEMLLEASRSGIQEVKLVARPKTSSSAIKKSPNSDRTFEIGLLDSTLKEVQNETKQRIIR